MKFSLSARPLSHTFLSVDAAEPFKRPLFKRAAGPSRQLVAGD